jgi:PilZ domain
MPSDVSVVIADNSNLAAIRDTASLPGRVMPFATTALASAIASIQAYRPKTIAIDAIFADTAPGIAFIGQVEPLMRGGGSILLLVEDDGRWGTVPRGSARARSQSPRVVIAEPRIEKPSAQAVAAISTPAAAVAAEIVSTRRAPRFLVKDPIDVIVESGPASLVDMSVLGAQIVSGPVLRPKQKIKVDLTDADKTLSVIAHVAWSMFEKPPSQPEPHYRVGLEFTGAAQQALEKYRQRHCTAQPIPIRTR